METEGSGVFRKLLAQANDSMEAASLEEIADWADDLESKGFCRVYSRRLDNPSLHVRTRLQGRNLAIGFNWGGRAQVTLYRDAFEELAPKTLSSIRSATRWPRLESSTRLKMKTDVKPVTDDLLRLLTKAYEEAASKEA